MVMISPLSQIWPAGRDTCTFPILRGLLNYSYCVCSNTSAAALQCLFPLNDCPTNPAPSTASCSTRRPGEKGDFLNSLGPLYETQKHHSQHGQHRYSNLQTNNRSKSPISPEIWFIRPARQPNGPQTPSCTQSSLPKLPELP